MVSYSINVLSYFPKPLRAKVDERLVRTFRSIRPTRKPDATAEASSVIVAVGDAAHGPDGPDDLEGDAEDLDAPESGAGLLFSRHAALTFAARGA